jgi:ASC-1-like (ASCH) protein
MPKVDNILELSIREAYLRSILNGQKRLEIRVGYDYIRALRPGQLLRLVSPRQAAVVRIVRVTEYRSFDELAAAEDCGLIIPAATQSEVIRILRRIYSRDKERLGVFSIGIERPVEIRIAA